MPLGASPKDYDFVVDNDEDMERFESLFLRKSFVLGKKPIQTRRLVAGEISLDINRYHGTIGDDLRRRDFTINAIAYDLKRDIILDPMNGLSDLEARDYPLPGRAGHKRRPPENAEGRPPLCDPRWFWS